MCSSLQIRENSFEVDWPVTKNYNVSVVSEEGVNLTLVIVHRMELFDNWDYTHTMPRKLEPLLEGRTELIFAHKQSTFYEIVKLYPDNSVTTRAVSSPGIAGVWEVAKEMVVLRRIGA